MKKMTITRLVVMLFALTLIASGCAKKPAADDSMAQDSATVQIDQQQASGIVEQNVSDSAVNDAAARAAAERAAADAAMAAEQAAKSGLQRIHFDFDQYVLTEEAKAILVSNAALLSSAPGVRIQIEGHCDERGSDEYNLALGEKRALATKNFLVSLGVADSRMSVISYGEEMPLDPSGTKDAWYQNRRAEFKIKR